jgi:excisionase family DNA binding protein
MEATVIESPYLGYDQAAAYCNVDRTTIWRAVKAGYLKASGPGRAVRFHRDELTRWMDSRNRK